MTIGKAGGLEAHSEHRISRGCESSLSAKAKRGQAQRTDKLDLARMEVVGGLGQQKL